MKIALATCSDLPDLDEEGAVLIAALARRGADAMPAVWDDPTVPWSTFDAVVLRSTWDYQYDRERFLEWAGALGGRLINPPAIVEWGTHKRYLEELAGAGLAIVPSLFLRPGELRWPDAELFVVKPAVSGGSKETAKYDRSRMAAAEAHVRSLHDAGREVLVQPYRASVDATGETAAVYIEGRFTHALWKGPLLQLDQPLEEGLFRKEEIELRDASPAELDLAERAVRWVSRRFTSPAYARVDMVVGDGGAPEILELELVEPSLFLDLAPQAAERLAESIVQRAAGGEEV